MSLFLASGQEVSGQAQLFVIVGPKGWPPLGAHNAAASYGLCLALTSYSNASVLGMYLETGLVLLLCVLGRGQEVSGQAHFSVCSACLSDLGVTAPPLGGYNEVYH